MPLHAQKKGKAGEVQFCKWLKENLDIEVERNYNQADGHSSDVITDDFIFEVKRRESIDLDTWWHQVAIAKKNHKDDSLIPIVAFRQNRKSWQFAIPANLLPSMTKGYMVMNERVFIEFAKTIIPEKEEEAEVECEGHCGLWGKPNYDGEQYYCGTNPRCIP